MEDQCSNSADPKRILRKECETLVAVALDCHIAQGYNVAGRHEASDEEDEESLEAYNALAIAWQESGSRRHSSGHSTLAAYHIGSVVSLSEISQSTH